MEKTEPKRIWKKEKIARKCKRKYGKPKEAEKRKKTENEHSREWMHKEYIRFGCEILLASFSAWYFFMDSTMAIKRMYLTLMRGL